MIIKCKYCKTEIVVNEEEFSPGDVVTVECRRCGDFIDVTIPERVVAPAADTQTSVVNVVKADNQDVQEVEPVQDVSESVESFILPQSDDASGETEVLQSSQSEKKILKKTSSKKSKSPTVSNDFSDLSDSATEVTPKKKTNSKKSIDQKETSTPEVVIPKKKPNSVKTSGKKKELPVSRKVVSSPPEKEKGSTTLGCGCLLAIAAILFVAGYGVYKFWPLHGKSEVVEEAAYPVEEVLAEEETYTNPDGSNIEEGYIPEEMLEEADSVVVLADSVAAYDEDIIAAPVYKMGFHRGQNYLLGEMINTDGARYPFTLEFDYDPDDDSLSDIIYVNTTSKTRLVLNEVFLYESKVRLAGRDGGKDFILQFSNTTPYSGDAWWGEFHQDIELKHQ